jgi:hypothetical protein
MIHPATRLAFINDTIGYGVVATELIPRGTVVWVKDPMDQVMTQEDVARLSPLYKPMIDRYSYEEEDGSIILCWDHARFVNHSCEATCLSAGFTFEIVVRDVHPGEQLTDDYSALCIKESFECACGSPTCRGIVRPEDVARMGTVWRPKVERALTDAQHVRQPLMGLLPEKGKAMLERSGGGYSNGLGHHPAK